MPKLMLNTPELEVRTGGFWRTVVSFALRDPEVANWLVVDRERGSSFRLSQEEQHFLESVARQLAAVELAPDHDESTKGDRRARGKRVLADGIHAIIAARGGDRSALDELSSLDQAEFASYVRTGER